MVVPRARLGEWRGAGAAWAGARLPASVQANGETSSETVLLRLITERGRPSVKIGASEEVAG